MEIKFRAWNKNLNRSGGMIWNVAVLNGKYFDPYEMETQEYPIMQYTGLKDLKGVEIYKGDIVEFARGRHQVSFLDGSFVLYDRNQWHIPFYTIHGGIEVIGNIYENPELI